MRALYDSKSKLDDRGIKYLLSEENKYKTWLKVEGALALSQAKEGFIPKEAAGEIGAPFDGEVTAAFPTGHAFGLKRKDGLECLIHVGMDTVQLNGKGFDVKVKQGQMVKKGDTLVVVDLDEVRAAGKSLVTPVIFTEGTPVKMLKKDTQISRGEEDILKF